MVKKCQYMFIIAIISGTSPIKAVITTVSVCVTVHTLNIYHKHRTKRG